MSNHEGTGMREIRRGAFVYFFRRAKLGEKPGYPRFKSKNRFPGFGFKAHGDGFLFESGPNWKNGYLRISGIGWMQVRGEARTPGDVTACSIMRKVDGWYLSRSEEHTSALQSLIRI